MTRHFLKTPERKLVISRENACLLAFPSVIGLCLNLLAKSLQIEIGDFLKWFHPNTKHDSKQAFSKGRSHIRPEAFQALFAMTANEALENEAARFSLLCHSMTYKNETVPVRVIKCLLPSGYFT
jgi:hypothetical protein